MRFLALAALALAGSAANDDYVALKALYEATGGSGWTDNTKWDMSYTNVCGWINSTSQILRCSSGGRVTDLCASAMLPPAPLSRRSR